MLQSGSRHLGSLEETLFETGTAEWLGSRRPGGSTQHISTSDSGRDEIYANDASDLLATGWSFKAVQEHPVELASTSGEYEFFQRPGKELMQQMALPVALPSTSAAPRTPPLLLPPLAEGRLAPASLTTPLPNGRASTSRPEGPLLAALDPQDGTRAGPSAEPASPEADARSCFSSESRSEDGWSVSDDVEELEEDRLDSLDLTHIIGRGAFGSVYRTVWKGRDVAVKVGGSTRAVLPAGEEKGRFKCLISLQVIEHEDEMLSDEDDFMATMGSRDRTHTSVTQTQASQAMMEAAMAGAVSHKNIVQTYDCQVVDPIYNSTSGEGQGRLVRVCSRGPAKLCLLCHHSLKFVLLPRRHAS